MNVAGAVTNEIGSEVNRMVNEGGSIATQLLPTKDGVRKGERDEGTLTKRIESVTSKVPSGAFLATAFGAMGLSATLHAMGRKKDANFVGQWVPTILIMGLYNKVVKQHGSSASE